MPKIKAQMSLDDRLVDNPELLELLENREALKVGARDYRTADKVAKAKIKTLEEPMPFRIGRFIVDKKERGSRSVSFEMAASESISITAADA